MAKNNRVKGSGGRFDFGEPGYLDNLRRRVEAKPSQFDMERSHIGTKLCSRCKARKTARGGRGGFGRPFICADCCSVGKTRE